MLSVLTSESSHSDSDDIFHPQSQALTSTFPVHEPTIAISTVKYTLLSRTCDRYGVSDRARAAIPTAALHTSTKLLIKHIETQYIFSENWQRSGNVLKRPVVPFHRISTELSDFSFQGISTDQTYLYRIVSVVSTDEALQMFKLIGETRYLPIELKVKIDPIIKRNSYFAHPENLLIAMLTDSEPHIRELEVHQILKARSVQENELGTALTSY
ncbi:hypothetical protein AVEN_220959-1 [Araneus ventricosus]|uniref:Uncharacterized protein n=1 Tax=Araneus ventricosus TaxID=182803 RepID=A0A4Y2H8N7_ARAVE|nr:hypothetical protein AVEN_220959-1 [Araneus ventricosus]